MKLYFRKKENIIQFMTLNTKEKFVKREVVKCLISLGRKTVLEILFNIIFYQLLDFFFL